MKSATYMRVYTFNDRYIIKYTTRRSLQQLQHWIVHFYVLFCQTMMIRTDPIYFTLNYYVVASLFVVDATKSHHHHYQNRRLLTSLFRKLRSDATRVEKLFKCSVLWSFIEWIVRVSIFSIPKSSTIVQHAHTFRSLKRYFIDRFFSFYIFFTLNSKKIFSFLKRSLSKREKIALLLFVITEEEVKAHSSLLLIFNNKTLSTAELIFSLTIISDFSSLTFLSSTNS